MSFEAVWSLRILCLRVLLDDNFEALVFERVLGPCFFIVGHDDGGVVSNLDENWSYRPKMNDDNTSNIDLLIINSIT